MLHAEGGRHASGRSFRRLRTDKRSFAVNSATDSGGSEDYARNREGKRDAKQRENEAIVARLTVRCPVRALVDVGFVE